MCPAEADAAHSFNGLGLYVAGIVVVGLAGLAGFNELGILITIVAVATGFLFIHLRSRCEDSR